MKKHIKNIIIKSKSLRIVNKLLNPNLVILRYHSIKESPELFNNSIGSEIIHSADLFDIQMCQISKYYNPVSLDDVFSILDKGETIPEKSVAITFDDGYLDNYEIALPILDKYNVPATFYITSGAIETDYVFWYIRLRYAFWQSKETEWVDPKTKTKYNIQNPAQRNDAIVKACENCTNLVGENQDNAVREIERILRVEPITAKDCAMMSWEQIRKLQKSGHIIGSHTVCHPNTAYASDEDLAWELTESKKIIETKTKTIVNHFSYPNPAGVPHWSLDTIKSVRRANYKTAVTSSPGPVNNQSNLFSIPRMSVPFTKTEFIWDLEFSLMGRVV